MRAHTCARKRAHALTHTRTHARARAHTHTHTQGFNQSILPLYEPGPVPAGRISLSYLASLVRA